MLKVIQVLVLAGVIAQHLNTNYLETKPDVKKPLVGDKFPICQFWPWFESSQESMKIPIDVERYMGQWYEQARLPQVLQIGRCSNVKYEINPSLEHTFNIDISSSDHLLPSEGLSGSAIQQSYDRTNTKFWTDFNFFVKGQYWVLDVDQDYQVAVVGDPCRYGLWVYSRERHLDIEIVLQKLHWARDIHGYHVDNAIHRDVKC